MLSDSVQDSRCCFDFFAKKGQCFLGRFDSRRFGREPSWAQFLASSRKFAALRSWEMQLDLVVGRHLKLNTGIVPVTCNYATTLCTWYFDVFSNKEHSNFHGRGRKQTIMESQCAVSPLLQKTLNAQAKWVIGWAMVGSHLSRLRC